MIRYTAKQIAFELGITPNSVCERARVRGIKNKFLNSGCALFTKKERFFIKSGVKESFIIKSFEKNGISQKEIAKRKRVPISFVDKVLTKYTKSFVPNDGSEIIVESRINWDKSI